MTDLQAYSEWVRDHDQLTAADDAIIRRRARLVPAAQALSIVVANPAADLASNVSPTMQSLLAQLDASAPVVAVPLPPGGLDPVAAASAALASITTPFVLFLPADARMATHAAAELASLIHTAPEVDIVYADEDQVDDAGSRHSPRFKTGWDSELMLAYNAIGSVAAFRVATIDAAGGLRPAATLDLALYDLLLRIGAMVVPSRIHHIPSILFHRSFPFGTPTTPDGASSQNLVQKHLDTVTLGCRVLHAPLAPTLNQIVYPLPSPAPTVSIIVPIRDRPDLLAHCAEGVLSGTRYPDLELLIIDNGSIEPATAQLLATFVEHPRVTIVRVDEPFNFSRLNNLGVGRARGDIVVLLNNDTKIIGPDWLTELISHAIRPEVGAVGAKLLYGDDRVQHCGVTLGPGRRITHQLRLSGRFDPGPNGELAVTRTVSAVTGACMAMRKSVFLEAGGLDENRFKIAFNDIDLCLRIGDLGYTILCTPFAELYHLESTTRGYDLTEAQQLVAQAEAAAFYQLWAPLIETDPFHNPNLLFDWNASTLAAPPRQHKSWRIETSRQTPGSSFSA